ncbi:SpoIIIAH-like family protein [Paenibacillus filicis]|uniref:SpoIIIAH-like family protein n=1 Tax=Paenibacillus filicis TaxID=669464 RepID=A0ABU9DV37_9BACL
MNSKKQTIWLVSMLSLMVVLSAYYLFTEDVKELDVATSATGIKTNEIVVNTGQSDVSHPAGSDAKAVSGHADNKTTAKATDPKATDPKAADPKAGSAKAETPAGATDAAKSSKSAAAGDKAAQPVSKTEKSDSTTDAQALQNVQGAAKATSGTDYFLTAQMKRHDELSKQVEALMTIALDKNKTKEEAAKAQEELAKLQDTQDRVDSLEESLMKDFPQAIVTQDASKWKITVQATKLVPSQAVTIVDKAIQELGIRPDQIKVEMKP